jgi:hypothetical protein
LSGYGRDAVHAHEDRAYQGPTMPARTQDEIRENNSRRNGKN